VAGKGLVILHLDGVGHRFLVRAIGQGRMPAVTRLIAEEGYVALPYRCGIPSTTPYCQAGILYGDNAEIPSFRWWDKEAGILVAFGHNSSFKKVAHDSREAAEWLERYDAGRILARQLERLNSLGRSEDLVIFGEHREGRQVNFEHQVGGHGSGGG
jgi:hypothetical protein